MAAAYGVCRDFVMNTRLEMFSLRFFFYNSIIIIPRYFNKYIIICAVKVVECSVVFTIKYNGSSHCVLSVDVVYYKINKHSIKDEVKKDIPIVIKKYLWWMKTYEYLCAAYNRDWETTLMMVFCFYLINKALIHIV